MSTYDDIIEQNKRSLTQAQIAALAQAAQQYSIENAGNRAGALASARQQYDTGYRGLQNMGLAGANGAQPTSGEVPRLKTEIQTPFDQYNQRLKSVERQRVAALSGNMVYQNQLAAEEARRRALAEEEARRQAAARETDQARFQRAQAVANAINRNRTFGKVTAADLSVPSRKEYEASEVQAFNQASAKAANAVTGVANTFPSVMVRAAAAMVGLQDPYSVINTAQQNAQLAAVKETYQKADATLRGMDQTRKYGGTVDEKQYQATKRTRDEAKAVYDAEKSRREADTYRREVEKIQQQDPEYYDAIVTANNAKATPDAKKRASVVLADRAAKETVSAMGIQKTMTDADYDKLSKVIPDVRRALNVIDSQRQVQEQKKKTGTTGADYEQRDIDEQLAELKKLGYTEEEARQLIKSYDDERQVKMEYSYWQPAYSALYAHQGEKPTSGINSNEMNPIYWSVNGNPDADNKAMRKIGKSDVDALQLSVYSFMTQDQRDAYNAIYEKDGIKAANEYAKTIKPILEMQAAEADQELFEKWATDDSWLKRFQAWGFARGSNLLGSIPAMAEKLVVNAENIATNVATGGTGDLKKYSPNSQLSRASNWADIVQSSQAQRILEKHDNSNWGKVLSFAYQTGTSMADSLIAMGLSGALGEGATYALFFSSAGNQAYKDTIARGGTQGQAMAMSILSGAAEAVFEEVSLEQLTKTLKFGGKPFAQIVKQALVQAGVEGSEEFFTSVANMLSDMMVMGDKAEIDQAIKNNSLGKYLWDNLGMDAIGGFVSGLGFGAASMAGYGASKGINAVVDYKNKKALGGAVRENTAKMQEIKNTAILLGGETAETVQAVDKKANNTNVADMTVAVADDIRSLEEKGPDTQAATLALIEGAEMDLQQASDVRSILGEEELTKRGYNASSDEAFQRSYNDKVTSNDMTSRSELQQQSKLQKRASKVWKDPNLGYIVTADGKRAKSMPGNMTSVPFEDQVKSKFAARTTAKSGGVTYAIAGMEAREGLTNDQKVQEIKKNLNREYRAKAEFFEKLSKALPGISFIVHDEMNGADGVYDKNTNAIHISLSSKQSVLRVTAHELTHMFKEESAAKFDALKNAIIEKVGKDEFDRLARKKAEEYTEMGDTIDYDTEKGRLKAEEETVAELCERMLNDTEWLEEFCEKHTETANTLKENLLKIINAIKKVLKELGNQGFGTSWSKKIEGDTAIIEKWYDALDSTLENIANGTVETPSKAVETVKAEKEAERETRQETVQEAKTEAAQKTETSAEDKNAPGRLAVAAVRRQIDNLKKTPGNEAEIADLERKLAKFEAKRQAGDVKLTDHSATDSTYSDLYMGEEAIREEAAKKAAGESAKKKTYVPGFKASEVDSVIDAGIFGDKSNYEGDGYENARAMIAQTIPNITAALEGKADAMDVYDEIRTAVGVMLDDYFEDEGDTTDIRSAIPSVIGVDTTAKGDLKHQDQTLFQMSAKLSKALGKRVTLVGKENAKGQRNAKYESAEKLDELWPRIRDSFGLGDDMDFSVDLPKLLEFIEQQADTRKSFRDLYGSQRQEIIESQAMAIWNAAEEMYSEKTGKRFSLPVDEKRTQINGRYDKGTQFEEHKYFAGIASKMSEQNPTGYTKVGEIRKGSIYTRIGLPAGATYFDNSKILGELNKKLDPLPVELMKQIPTILAHPTVIVEATKANTVSVFGEVRTESGAPILVGVMATKDDHGKNVITKIRTVHPRLADISKLITKDSILYITENKKKAREWFQASRIKMPLSETNLGYVRSITLSSDLVNMFSHDTDDLRAQKEYEQKTDAAYSEWMQAKQDLQEAEKKRKEILESKEYNDMLEAFTGAKDEALDAAIRQYVDFMNKSGANETQKTIDRLSKKVEQLKEKFDKLTGEHAASEREKAIEKSGLSEQDYDRKQAEKQFGYTPYFYDAGYMLPNGRLLNFSGEKGKHFGQRGQDHRAIGIIYDDSQGSEAMIRFMNGGNIRVMAETPGIDISNAVEPTREQYAKIRSFAQESAGKRFFNVDISDENGNSVGALSYDGRVSPDRVVNDIKHYFATGEIRQQSDVSKFLYSMDTDDLRENVHAFTQIDADAFKAGLEQLKNVTPGKGMFALKDISRFLDTISGGDKELRDTLNKVFEKPHNQALKNYATGVEKMQQRVLDIGQRAGVCDAKGRHFDAKKSAAIQNIGEGYSNRQTDVTVRVVDADAVRVTATDKETGKSLGTKDYTFRELKRAYGREVASTLWSQAFDASEKAGKHVDIEREVNTQPYTIEDLQNAYPGDWQKLKAAADEFRSMYDEYIQSINQMLEQIYPYASKYAAVDKITEAIEKKQAKLDTHKEAEQNRIAELNKKLGAKEAEMAAKKRTDTKAYRNLWEQVENLKAQIQEAEADLKEYEASVKDELTVMGEEKAVLQNAEQEGDSLSRMHRLEYREDYFHHFQEMASGVQNLKAIFTNNTDISPAVVGKSDQTKPKSRFAGFFQHRTGSNYTADALKGMLRYGQLAEYKLAFDPLSAYLRNAIEDVKKLDPNATNRDNLIRYLRQWTNAILGKSHDVDRAIVDSGFGMRSKVFKTLDWINSRVIQNTLLWNMRSALLQISNVTNAKGIVTNNLDWAKGLWKWALAARGNEQMRAIMSQSTFLASRYMDDLQLTPGAFKTPRQFAAWLLGALDEVSAKATWWAAYTQYQRNPNAKVIRNAYRSYDNAIDYADDVTRRTHAGRGVGELAPAMTSKMINFVAPFQVEVNNTYQLLKDNVKRGNYLGLLSTGVSVFLLNTLFEAITGSTPLGFDFIRAIIDICFGIAGDDPDDDKDDYGVKQVAQRLAGEFVGGLPYAQLIAGAIGDDYAKELFGEDTDMTRYGHTQIGLGAIINTVRGLSDISNAIVNGKNLFTQTNFISDIDDLLNLTLPMGGKQLTRTAEGIKTVAKGYGSKVNKQGEEQVQFATEQDLLHYLHAGLFGKWALTEASEFFGEERLLPKLFGAYEGPKSSVGTAVDAKTYKAALDIGITGKEYFTLRYDLSKYSTQVGKRAEMMEQKDLTKEQKAQLDALMIPDKSKEVKTEGPVVYQKNSDGGWDVKADYSSKEWMQAAELGDTRYRQAKAAADLGMKPQTYIDIYEKWKGMSGKDKKQQAKEYLDSLHLPKKQYDYIWAQVFKYKAE